MRTTVAIVEEQGAEFTFQEVEIDGPRPDEVLIRIVTTGLCHTDLSLRDTLPPEMFPRVFGHEGAGVVEEVGAEVAGIAVGDHVVMSLRSCRTCARCTAGEVGYCESSLVLNYLGFRLDGSTTYTRDGTAVQASFFGQSSFSQHAIATADNVVVVDRALDLTLVAPYGCGFQAGAGAVLNVLRPGPEDSLVVYGVGAVGLAAVVAARASGVETVLAVDLRAARLEQASAYGAVAVDAGAHDEGSVVDRVRALTGGGATYAVETTAVPSVLTEAVQALGPRGELVVLGLDLANAEFTVDAIDLLQNGKTIRGSVEGDSDPLEMLPRMLSMRATGDLDLDRLVTTYPFAQINTAVGDVLAGRVVKPVLVW